MPILVEVIAPPRFDPDFVRANSYGHEPDAGERGPWVTEVRGFARSLSAEHLFTYRTRKAKKPALVTAS